MALSDGLFADDFETESFRANGFMAYDDFLAFGERLSLMPKRLRRILDAFRGPQPRIEELVGRSFLPPEFQEKYLAHYRDKFWALNYSFQKLL